MAKVTDMNSAARVLGAAAPQYKTSDATKRAYAALKNAYSNRNSWSKRIRTNIKRLYAMGDFDPNKSAYYQNAYHSLKQAYQNTGKRDMLNAAATATANTGGLANSYAATAANQAYQARLSELAGKVPELYTAAESEFTNRKNNLADVIAMQQQAQQEGIEKAKFMLDTQRALDAARYNAAKYADSAARNTAKLWWQRYMATH